MGVARFLELEGAVMATVRAAVEQRADAYLFLGDLCDPDSGACVFRCVELILRVARELSDAGIEFHALAGNHCCVEDGSGDTVLTPLRALEGDYVHLHERPRLVYLPGFVSMQTLPFTATSHAYDPAAQPGLMTADVVAGHLHVPGCVPGEETLEMPRGREVLFPLDRLRERERPARLLLNGHYHRRQHTSGVYIPGSLARLTFAEKDHSPGYLVFDL